MTINRILPLSLIPPEGGTAVFSARKEEIEYVHKMKLYDKVPITECRQRTGKGPISVRWIDINKGDATSPNYRPRLVAREINTYKRSDLFAATPPLESLKYIIRLLKYANLILIAGPYHTPISVMF